VARGPAQGEALLTWALSALATAVVAVTYARLDPDETYHVSREGLAGGLSRALTLFNFPIALVAIGLVLVAVAALPRSAWLVGAPAIALCATVPLFVDQDDLDARLGNALPAAGVLLALGLTFAATRAAGAALAPRRPWDGWRVGLAAVVGLESLPWIAAELGFHFPGDLFMGEEIGLEADGTQLAAVHLGHHHGTDGALLVLSALLLSRVRIDRAGLRIALAGCLGLMFAYGAVNLVQDGWNEQLVKRGTVDARIPSALLPGFTAVWGVVLALAALATLAVLREQRRTAYSAA
jgi:hypothetical protein